MQLGLQGVRVRVAAVDDVEDGAGVSAVSHEDLGRVVLDLVLSIDACAAGRAPWQSDDAVDERQLIRRVASGTNEKVLVSLTPVPDVEEVIVNIRE